MAKKKISIAVDQQPANQPTRLIFLLDRSTSMDRMKEEAVAGYNQYLQGQKESEGEAKISLIFFDSQFKVVYDQVNIKDAQPIVVGYGRNMNMFNSGVSQTIAEANPLAYTPQGMTSLFDYIHLAISMYKETAQPNEKTIVTILTDGDDTSSRTHSYSSVHRLITEVQNELKWEVMFLGANMNAKAFAQSVGIKMTNATQFDYTGKGLGDAMRTMNLASSYTRGDTKARGLVASVGAAAACGDVDMTALYSTVAESTADDLQTRLDKFKADKAAKPDDTK